MNNLKCFTIGISFFICFVGFSDINQIVKKNEVTASNINLVKNRPDWLTEYPYNHKDLTNLIHDDSKEIKQKNYYEVSLQAISSAYIDLEKEQFVEIGENTAISYTRGHYEPEDKKKPYLVRAAFSNSTGMFTIRWDQQSKVLLISHNSLGGSSNAPRWALPLILNLESKPRIVYIHVSGA